MIDSPQLEEERVRWFGRDLAFSWPWRIPHISYGYQSQYFGGFEEVTKFGVDDGGTKVGLGRSLSQWDKSKFDEWRWMENKEYREKLGYVKAIRMEVGRSLRRMGEN